MGRVQIQLVQMIDGEPVKVNLSALPEQRSYLEKLGDGNVSAGFRKIFENAMELVALLPEIVNVSQEGAGFLCIHEAIDLIKEMQADGYTVKPL